jgi:hypothetical protein
MIIIVFVVALFLLLTLHTVWCTKLRLVLYISCKLLCVCTTITLILSNQPVNWGSTMPSVNNLRVCLTLCSRTSQLNHRLHYNMEYLNAIFPYEVYKLEHMLMTVSFFWCYVGKSQQDLHFVTVSDTQIIFLSMISPTYIHTVYFLVICCVTKLRKIFHFMM